MVNPSKIKDQRFWDKWKASGAVEPSYKKDEISPQKDEDPTPYYLFIDQSRFVLGTPRGIAQSERTIDLCFNDFAENPDLQEKLHIGSYIYARPLVHYAEPAEGEELIRCVAGFMSAFCSKEEEREQRRDYMLNNGLVRLLVLDDKLRSEIATVIALNPVVRQVGSIITAEYDFGKTRLRREDLRRRNPMIKPVYDALYAHMRQKGYVSGDTATVPYNMRGDFIDDPEHQTFRLTVEIDQTWLN